ncbi:MAG: hypothetical protein J6Y30_01305 [Treponema sp.]|nr:hypothetical protein [Treponema sp.]MBP5436597.1 hypothetical protein [Treponema sp.]MBP5577674.1 hypothetical protein [Treponema sp.]
MNNTTRKIAIFALLLAAAVAVHAYTKDDAIVNYMGSYSRYSFTKEWSNADTIAENLRERINLTNFYRITEENIDKEDYNVRDFAEKNLASYDTSDNNVYMTIVTRNVGKETYDGWIILTHCSKAEGFFDYIFYFSAQ